MSISTPTEDARQLSSWSIAIGAMMMIAGALAIGLPAIAGTAVYSVVAWMLILCGVGHSLFAWNARSLGGALWQALMGVLYVGVGAYLVTHPLAGLATLTLMIAAYWFVDGVLELILSSQMRGAARRRWFIFEGIVTLILAVLIWRTWPSHADRVIGTWSGSACCRMG